MFTFFVNLKHHLYNSNLLYHLRIFIALAGTTAMPWWIEQPTLTIPLTLGVVAAALTDLDDSFTGRLRNLFITLVCFFIASTSIELLFPYPWLFAIGLTSSTCCFTLLGALGQRYATIAFGALLIAIYTMLGTAMYPIWYQQPLLLILGAAWYNLLTLSGHLIFPTHPLQDNLAQCYQQLARYLETKANLFDPDIDADTNRPLINVAMANRALVDVLNQTKASLLTRLQSGRSQHSARRALHYYFVVQDIHERASSSHVHYQTLREKLRYSDILFRLQRLFAIQAQACQQLAQSILRRQKYQHSPHFERAATQLETSLTLVFNHTENTQQISALSHLLKNLRAIDTQLSNIESEQLTVTNPPYKDKITDNRLTDDRLTGWDDIWLRISRHFTLQSVLFRHAIRMSVVLCFGYTIIQLIGMQYGYWILLTSLFVCQPNYNATRRRLKLRVAGTVAGILTGLPILYFVPSTEGQLILIVISGVLFFTFRNIRYAHATMFITLLVLLCFNLLGEGFNIAIPRTIDTLLGCSIAWVAVSFIWPDWKFHQLPLVIEKTLNANCRYLDVIVVQYHQGRDNSLFYRKARRDAHNGDAEFAGVISSISSEPKINKEMQETAFNLLCLNHTLLSYIAALGAHREKLTNTVILNFLNEVIHYVEGTLQQEQINDILIKQTLEKISADTQQITAKTGSKEQLVLQQIRLILELLPEFVKLNKKTGQRA